MWALDSVLPGSIDFANLRSVLSKSIRGIVGLVVSRLFSMTVPPQDYVFIADEAGISNDRFTVVGGLCMHRETLRRAYDTLKVYRDKHNMHAELKWSKVSRQKLGEYMTLVEYFFAMNNSNHMHFHSIVFDSHRWAHKKYNEGSITYEIRDKNKADIIKKTDPDTLVDFIFMALDNAGIIDHGGYIGNGWITEEGKEFLGLLKEFKDED